MVKITNQRYGNEARVIPWLQESLFERLILLALPN